MKKYIKADQFFFVDEVKGAGFLEIVDGKFGKFSATQPKDGEIVDCSGKWVSAGLVDSHIHGLLGYDVMDNDIDGLKKMSKGLLTCGITSFMPTTLTASVEQLNGVVENIGKHYKEIDGARIEGIYLEGPFFTEKHKGAQNPAYFSDPCIDKLKEWQKLSGGFIKKISLAPERQGSKEFIEYAVKNNVIVALGHSDATYEQAKIGVESGATIFTHTYNGMSPLHHREPGMVGAAMTLPNAFAEIICDGKHVHPAAVKALFDARGRDNCVLVSDGMCAGLMPEGAEYMLGDFPVIVKDGFVRLKDSGSLAASVLRLDHAVKNIVDWKVANICEAIKMATIVPAKASGIDNTCGQIKEGRNADFVIWSNKLNVEQTYLAGEKVF